MVVPGIHLAIAVEACMPVTTSAATTCLFGCLCVWQRSKTKEAPHPTGLIATRWQDMLLYL